ncbi:MAG: Zn-dependent hydrolase [Clostridia bacterium]|nr:Zn-dependent hydrolase [Clostridia bacterium]
MKKTYITTMPNHIGAFLKASRLFSELGINITRVSYNKAVDSHTLFLDAEGSKEQLEQAEEKLHEIGYLQNDKADSSVVLLEFCLKDEPGSVTDVLALIDEFHFNISYISSQENGTEYQLFKMGLYVDDAEKISAFLTRAESLCQVRVMDYNHAEKVYDNSIFYNSFVSGIARTIGLSEENKNELLVNANLAMQLLDEQGLSPYKTFDSIGKFAELLAVCRGGAFSPRITRHAITDNTEITLIEPPCGSNTMVIKSGNEILFVDSGYALYREEMQGILHNLFPEEENLYQKIFLTHADVDHCGLLPMFDEILVSRKTAECLKLEYEGKAGFREESPLHKPYVRMCRVLTSQKPPEPEKVKSMWGTMDTPEDLLTQIGFFDFGELHFEVYEGKGAHLPGETVLIDYGHHVAFTGDIYINLKGLTAEQKEYNQYAPILMNSVDTDPKESAMERTAILQRLGAGNWQIFGSHGYKKEYSVQVEQ